MNYAYTTAGSYVAALRVKDEAGGISNLATFNVQVNPPDPVQRPGPIPLPSSLAAGAVLMAGVLAYRIARQRAS